MPSTDSAELKRQLRTAEFEIYRSSAGRVLLAERVRDNLIMDSGVSAESQNGALSVRVVVRAQASHYPGAEESQIWQHARDLAKTFIDLDYAEEGTHSEPVPDPSDPSRSLDTCYEVRLNRKVSDLPALFDELRAALSRQRSTSQD